MRKVFVFGWLLSLLSGVILLFWYNEGRYRLPTPVPPNYTAVPRGTLIQLKGIAGTDRKPMLLHFFNPDCPCSKFNLAYVKKLVKQYGSQADFTLVLVTARNYSPEEIQQRFDLTIPIVQDRGLSALCGVYSTPQAVILDTHRQLYYRGNYNRSRYCVDKTTNYAEAALLALLKNDYTVTFAPMALKAYGCQLPGCSRQ